ncbi:sensor histidine kinase [Paenibacillus sp. FSL W7-1287]|uniref:sensor histidine kinase n=1 Tax=Paenibacillus sp. FSL W7-1287 TaxID=2954538 RepID=UPI0030FCC9E1
MNQIISFFRRTYTLLFFVFFIFSLVFIFLISTFYNIYWDGMINSYHEQMIESDGYKLLDDMREKQIAGGPLKEEDVQWLKRRTRLYGVLMEYVDNENKVWFDTISEYAGKLTVQTQVPYVVQGSLQGQIKLAQFEASSELNPAMVNFRETLKVRSKMIFVTIMLLSTIISFLLATVLTKYLIKLDQYAQLIRQGKWHTTFPIKGPEEIRRLAITLKELAIELDKQEELRKNLMEDMMHELRTPITSIMTRLEATIDGVYEANDEQLEKMYNELDRLSRLLHDMQRVSVAQGATFEMRVKRTDVVKLCQNVYLDFRMLAKKAEVDMRFEPTYTPHYAEVDRDKLSQVVTNLLSNAIKYTQPGGRIVLQVECTQDQTIIKCMDTGIGISEEDLPYIFNRLFRADKSRSRFTGGVGLGLTIAKALVEAHRGEITVSSEYGKGSIFTVIIPSTYMAIQERHRTTDS